MSEFRLSPEAEAELDGSWLYVARGSGRIDTANRVIDDITDAFWALARHPYIGRKRDHDLRPGLRTFVAGQYVIVHRIAEDGAVVILHIFHGKRDVGSLLSP
jgi:plasmid stabilization system protein ParE